MQDESPAVQPAEPGQSNPIAGVCWMIVTGLMLVGVTAMVKVLGTRIPAVEAAFLRFLLGLVFAVPMLLRAGEFRFSRGTWGLFGLRGLAHMSAVILWFYAMARIPLADVTAMNYMSPIYVTIGAALFLGERLAMRRILAVVAGLVGALIILRPGFREVGPGHLAMVFAAMIFGASYIIVKLLSHRCSPAVVVAMLSISVTILLAPLAALNWVTPTWTELGILLVVAGLATAGHYVMTRAFQAAPLAVTQPVTFLQLVWAVSLGAFVFGEPLDPWVIVGGLVIVAAVSFISWREAVLKRRALTPARAATKL
ncbi:MAG: DMT family transporter [Roseovarius sp.]|uniref:DMT family transporter n=1 Tax=Roseovarius sp. TaxID=1486281 RepID=UPI0032EF5EC2